MSESYIFKGAISVKSVLEQERRNIIQLVVNKDKRSRDFAYIIAIAKQKSIPVVAMKKAEFNEAFPDSGGIILEAGPRIYPDLSESLSVEDTQNEQSQSIHEIQNRLISNPAGLCVYVSGIEDPYNLGSTCRSLYAAGADLLILPKRDWSFAEATLQKASAGAWEKMNIVMCDADQTLKNWAQIHDLPIVCSARDNAQSLFTYKWPENCLLVIGGALRGISTTLLEGTEHVFIPYGRDFKNALDTPSAAAVMAFSYTRQFCGEE